MSDTNQLREAAERAVKDLLGHVHALHYPTENKTSWRAKHDQSIVDRAENIAKSFAATLATYAAEQLAGDGGGKAATIDKAKELHKGPPPNPPKGASQIYG